MFFESFWSKLPNSFLSQHLGNSKSIFYFDWLLKIAFVNKVPVGCRSSEECKNEASCIEGKCAKVDAFVKRARKMKKKSQEKRARGGQRSLRVSSSSTENIGNVGVVGTPELNIVEKD